MNKTLKRLERYLHTVNDKSNERFSKEAIRRLISHEDYVDNAYNEFMEAYKEKDAQSHEIQIKTGITIEYCRTLFNDLVICRNHQSFDPVFDNDGKGTYTITYSKVKEITGYLCIRFSLKPGNILSYSISIKPTEHLEPREMIKELISIESDTEHPEPREIIKELISNESDTDIIYQEFVRAYEEKDGRSHKIQINEKFTLKSRDHDTENEKTKDQLTPKNFLKFFKDFVLCINPTSPDPIFEEEGYRVYKMKYSDQTEFYIYFSIGWYQDLEYWISTKPIRFRDMGQGH